VTVGVGAAAVLVPALAYFIRVLALQGDWSAGAQLAGIFALVGLSIAVVGAIVRLIAGRNAAMFFVLTVLLLALLGGSSVGALAMSNPLHRIQAQSYESQSQWEAAIREYKLSGEEGADTADIARVYDEWGEQFLGQQSYSDAVDRFLTVLTDYRSDAAAVARAHRDLYKTYVAWLKDSPDDVPYAEAVTALTTYGTDSACDATCKADIAAAAPQALYLYGTQLAGDHRYAQAITQFEKLTADYAQSDYAPKAHSAAATAYYAEGQAELAQQSCTQAVDTYRTLVSKYGDTPEAAKARTALAAPQDVHGTITNFPKNPIPTMHLSHSINPKKFEFSNEYTTKPSSSGSYVFKKVKQGKYYITSSQPISGGTEYGWWYTNSTKTSYYSITVGPLCSANADELPF
jgi:outer membrane protein assembly factor BamD (BamD/ComL family)